MNNPEQWKIAFRHEADKQLQFLKDYGMPTEQLDFVQHAFNRLEEETSKIKFEKIDDIKEFIAGFIMGGLSVTKGENISE